MGVVGVLVTDARTGLGECVVPGWAVGALRGLAGAVFLGQQGGGQASSIVVQCAGPLPW